MRLHDSDETMFQALTALHAQYDERCTEIAHYELDFAIDDFMSIMDDNDRWFLRHAISYRHNQHILTGV